MKRPLGVALKPLVLLDVDGVVNWFSSVSRDHQFYSHGYMIHVATETVQALACVFASAHEVLWLTAWREKANEEILTFLREHDVTSEAELGFITDHVGSGKLTFDTRWKVKAIEADSRVQQAHEDGRLVVWIEDFGFGTEKAYDYSGIDELGPLVWIDTWPEGRLTFGHLEETPFDWFEHCVEGLS